MKALFFIITCLVSIGCRHTPATTDKTVPPVIQTTVPQQAKLSLEYKVRTPTITTEDTPVLFLLHGLGSNEKNFFDLAQQVDGRMLVISARAPISLSADRYSWYNLSRDNKGWSYKDAEVLEASEKLIAFVSEIKKKHKVSGPVYLGGFSQGAIMSLGTALRHPDKIKGAISLSGQLYSAFLDNHRRNYSQLEILVTHGNNDKVLPVRIMKENVKTLINKGLNPEVHYFDSEHTISRENYSAFINWLKQSLDK